MALGPNIPKRSYAPMVCDPRESALKSALVKSVDEDTFEIIIEDEKTGQGDVKAVMLAPYYNAATREGSYTLPQVGTKVVYMSRGGEYAEILGCHPGPVRQLNDDAADAGTSFNSGFESFTDLTKQVDKLESDFGFQSGDQGFYNEKGKIKLKRSGLIVIKSSQFLREMYIPGHHRKISYSIWNEERSPGYLKLRRAYISALSKNYNATYQREEVTDNSDSPKFMIRTEKGFCDKDTRDQNNGWSSPTNSDGPISAARNRANNALTKVTAHRVELFSVSPTKQLQSVYKEELRQDGGIVTQYGGRGETYTVRQSIQPNGNINLQVGAEDNPVFEFEVTPSGRLKIVAKGGIEVESDLDITLRSQTAINLSAPVVNQGTGGTGTSVDSSGNAVLNYNNLTIQTSAIDIYGSASARFQSDGSMDINAPAINSLPTATPPGAVVPPNPGDQPVPPSNPVPNPDNDTLMAGGGVGNGSTIL